MEPVKTVTSKSTDTTTATNENINSSTSQQHYIYGQIDSMLLSDKIRTMNGTAVGNGNQLPPPPSSTTSSSSPPYMNHDAFAAQVRTIMKAAGLISHKVSKIRKTNDLTKKPYHNSNANNEHSSNEIIKSHQQLSAHKMTLMAELFASEDEDDDCDDDDEEIYDDDYVEEPFDSGTAQNDDDDEEDEDDIDYEDDDDDEDDDEEEEEEEEEDDGDEEDEEEEENDGDSSVANAETTVHEVEDADNDEEDDDDDENSEIDESFIVPERITLDPSDPKQRNLANRLIKRGEKNHQLPMRDRIANLSARLNHISDPQLYHELKFTSSDVHCVLDEVGATIARMRISDNNHPMPCLLKQQPSTEANKNLAQVRAATSSSNQATVIDKQEMCKSSKSATESDSITKVSSYSQSEKNDCDDDPPFLDEHIHPPPKIMEKLKKRESLKDSEEKNDSNVFTIEDLQRKDVDKLLLYAASFGCYEMVEFLLKNPNIDINKCGAKEMTPLMEAASSGQLDIVCLLIHHCAIVDFKSSQGNTALMYAAATGHLEIVQHLVEKGANIEAQNDNGHTAMMEAASAGHIDIVRYLVSQGGSINVHSNEYKETAMTLAAYKGHLELVRYLIEIGSDLAHQNEEMHTALMEASMDGHVEVARLLLDSGAQVNMPPDSFESPLTLAACGGHVELALLLLERGANIEEVNDEGYTALMEASREGHEEMVALLLSHGAKINATTEDSKETALLMACGTGSIEVINLLVKAGADLELGAQTPLREAVLEGHHEIVKILLDSGAKVDAVNNSNETALNVAVENGFLDIVKSLLAAGACVDHVCNGGRTPLAKAAQSGRCEIISCLIEYKANVNWISPTNDCTPLSLACANGHDEAVEILLRAGADVYHRLKDSSTMLMEAAKNGNVDVLELLIKYTFEHGPSNGFGQQIQPSNIGTVKKSNANRKTVSGRGKDSSKNQKSKNTRILPACAKLEKKMPAPQPPSTQSSAKNNNKKLTQNVAKDNANDAKENSASSTGKSLHKSSQMSDPARPITTKTTTSSKTTTKKSTPTTVNVLDENRVYRKFHIPDNNSKYWSLVTQVRNIALCESHVALEWSKSCHNILESHDTTGVSAIVPDEAAIEEFVLANQWYYFHELGSNSKLDSTSLIEHFKIQCKSLGKENSDIYGQMIGSLFFNIFQSFSKLAQPNFYADRLFCEVIRQVVILVKSNSVDPSMKFWLDFRLRMLEIFKRCIHLYKKHVNKSQDSLPSSNELHVFVPGFVLRKFLSTVKIYQMLKINESQVAKLEDLFYHYDNTAMELEVPWTDFDADHFYFDFKNVDIFSRNKQSNNQEKQQQQQEQQQEENERDANKFYEPKIEKVNPEQVIFSIKEDEIVPIGYLEDSLFEVFFKLSVFFISSNKEEIMGELLSFVSDKPSLKSTMGPLFELINQKLCEHSKDRKMSTYQVPIGPDQDSDTDDFDLDTLDLDLDEMNTVADICRSTLFNNEPSAPFKQMKFDAKSKKSLKEAMKNKPSQDRHVTMVKVDRGFTDTQRIMCRQLTPERLNVLRIQALTSGLFVSYVMQIRTEYMLRASNLLRTKVDWGPCYPYQWAHLFNGSPMVNESVDATDESIQNISSIPAAEVDDDDLDRASVIVHDGDAEEEEEEEEDDDDDDDDDDDNDDDDDEDSTETIPLRDCTNALWAILETIPQGTPKGQQMLLLKEKLEELGMCDPKLSDILCSSASQTTPSTNSSQTPEQNELYKLLVADPLMNNCPLPKGSDELVNEFVCAQPSEKAQESATEMTDSSDSSIPYFSPGHREVQKRLSQTVKKKTIDPSSVSPVVPSAQTLAAMASLKTNPTKDIASKTFWEDSLEEYFKTSYQPPPKFRQNICSTMVNSDNNLSAANTMTFSKAVKKLTTIPASMPSKKDNEIPVGKIDNNGPAKTPLIIKKKATGYKQPNQSQQQQQSALSSKNKVASIDLNSHTDSNHDTALTFACVAGHADTVQLLINEGADIEHREKKGLTPLMLAATHGHHKIVQILIAHNADLEAQTDRTKDTALSLACSSGKLDVVDVLLSRGANKEHRNVSDYTPLSLAASGGYDTIINLLLSYGAEINSRTGSKLGISPLMLAAMNGHTETAKILLDRGSDINAYIETNKNTALTLACFQGRTEVVDLLLERNANIEHRAKTGLTPLMEAASGGYVDVGKVLLEKGAEVNASPVPTSRDTALTIASDKGHTAFVELLINHGANVDAKNKKGFSSLWLACHGGHSEVVELLITARCDVDAQDNRKVSCLMAAFRQGHTKIVKLMVRHVTQFPSDQEINRYLAICTDEELKKRAVVCAGVIRFAKERQAAEALKNAANLLEEIDQERSREESRKAAAARRREKRKQKKKEKTGQKDDDNEPKSKNDEKDEDGEYGQGKHLRRDGSVDGDEETNPITNDGEDNDSDSVEDLPKESNPSAEIVSSTTIKNNQPSEVATAEQIRKMKKKKKSKQNENSNVSPVVAQQEPPKSLVCEPEIARKDKKSKMRSLCQPTVPIPVANQVQPQTRPIGTQLKTDSFSAANDRPLIHDSESKTTKMVTTKNKNDDRHSERKTLHDSHVKSTINNNVKSKAHHESSNVAASTETTASNSKSVRDSSPTTTAAATSFHSKSSGTSVRGAKTFSNRRMMMHANSNESSSATTANNSNATTNGSKNINAELKREEGWKEVVRKSKKVLVPANAISRVIGRGGCNINTIREISGAHIEVEKQKGQGDRMVIIRGSADATRIASQLITVLSKEAEKDLSEIIRELGLHKPLPSGSSTATIPVEMILMTTANHSNTTNMEPSQVVTSNSNYSVFSTSATTRQTSKSVGRTPVSSSSSSINTTTTTGKGATSNNLQAINSNKNVPVTVANNPSTEMAIGNATTKSCHQSSVIASGTSNTVSYTMAVNSKTTKSICSNSSPNTSNNSNSSKNSSVKIMSAVYKPSNKSQIYANRNPLITNSNSYQNSQPYSKSTGMESVGGGGGQSIEPTQVNKSTHSPSNQSNEQSLKNSSEVSISTQSQTVVQNTSSTSSSNNSNNCLFNSLGNNYNNSNLIGSNKCNAPEKLNFASVAASGVSTSASMVHATSSTSLNSQKQIQNDINSDETASLASSSTVSSSFARPFVSPSSGFGGSSSFSTVSLSINTSSTNANVVGQPSLNSLSSSTTPGPSVGHVRSAPCTPPTSNYSPGMKLVNSQQQQQQQQQSQLSSNNQFSDLLTGYLDSNQTTTKPHLFEPFPPDHVQMTNLFQPPNMNQNSNNNTNFMNLMNNPVDATMANPSLNRTSTVSGSNFLDNRPITPFAGEQSHGKSQRSNLNPNAPDFSSRSNSFSTNTISQHQQPLLNLGNNLNPGSFNNLSQMPARNNFGNAPRISQDVRQMIVIHSMNLFQNQVPKRHQEAAARLAHLSAQSNSFVNNDMHNVFNPTAANQQINDKLSYLQYLRAANNGGVNNTNAADSYQIQAMLSQLQQPNSASSRLTTGSGSGSVSSTSASPVHSSTFSLSNYDSVPANAFVPTQSNSVIETLVEDNGTNSNVQKIKQPAPIGTERAQKKNPNPGYPTLSSTGAEPLTCFNPNNAVNANSLFDNNSIPWRLDNEEMSVPSDSSADLTNTHLNFGSSLGNSELMNDFFSTENSLSGLFNQLAGNGGGSNQQPAQRTASNQQSTRFNPIGDDFDYNTTSFNTSKPLFMQANNFLNPTINTSDPVVPDPAEYWHSSTSAVPKTSKTDPFDPKMQWNNNWNNNLN